MKLIIRNVTVVNASGQTVHDVFIEDGKLVGAFEDVTARVIDGTGLHLMPGVIDPHVHFRDPGATHKEDFESGSRAAAMGGVTTVLDMPNNDPAIVTVKNLQEKKALIAGRSVVNYGFHFGASANFDELQAVEGVVGAKVYMGSSTGDLLTDNPSAWERIFEICRDKDIPVIVHAENEQRIRERMREMHDEDAPVTHAKIRDCECARIAVEAAVALRDKVGNRLHIAHMTCKEEVEIVKQHANAALSCEVCPHHLYFTMDDMKDAFLKMNPPLRHEDDLRALWEGLRDGTVTCLATDHAPHTLEEKSKPHWGAPAGVPGVEFLLPLMLNEVNENMLPFERLVELTSTATARVFSLEGKGTIEEGMDADLVLVDLSRQHTIQRDDVQSKCGWSPYEGYALKGWPVMTIVNGVIVMEDGQLTGEVAGKDVCG